VAASRWPQSVATQSLSKQECIPPQHAKQLLDLDLLRDGDTAKLLDVALARQVGASSRREFLEMVARLGLQTTRIIT
jgi:hypothetical protein